MLQKGATSEKGVGDGGEGLRFPLPAQQAAGNSYAKECPVPSFRDSLFVDLRKRLEEMIDFTRTRVVLLLFRTGCCNNNVVRIDA